MRLPYLFFVPTLPLASSLAASIALAALYGVLAFGTFGIFGFIKYAPLVSAALGAGGKCLGFMLRSIFLVNHDLNVFAASSVFISAGMSACTNAQAAVLSDWFRNAVAAQRLRFHREHPRIIPTLCRLMGIPILAFGPGVGVPAAILTYGTRTPESIQRALRLRKWNAWGTLACLIVLTVASSLAFVLAVTEKRASKRSEKGPVLLVLSILSSILLIEVSGATRVRSVYDIKIGLEDNLYYLLIVLPELVQQLLTTWPTLLLQAGKADTYTSWRMAAWGWVRRISTAVSPDGLVDEGSHMGKCNAACPSIAVSDGAAGSSSKQIAIRCTAAS